MSKRPKPEVVKPPVGSRRPRREPQATNRPYAKDRCPVSGKRRFRDHREAVRALHRVANHRKTAREHGQESRRREVRCYRCKECRGWHLTSKPG